MTKFRRAKGLVVVCGKDGVVQELRRDDFNWAPPGFIGKPFETLTDPACRTKVQNFMSEIRRAGAAFDWELNVALDDQICPFHFSGANYAGDIFIVAAESRQAITALWEELEGSAKIRSSIPPVWIDLDVRDELSRLNNEVSNAYRELAKKNAELQKALEDKGLGDLRFQFLYESNLIGVLIANSVQIIDANATFLDITGYTRSDLRLKKLIWRDMLPREHPDLDENITKQLIEVGKCSPFRAEFVRKDGRRIAILVGGALLQRDPIQWAGFVIDVSEQKRREEAVRTAEQFAAAARLGSALAHEINNPLAILTNAVYLLKRQRSVSGTAEDLLQSADEALTRISSITRQLLSLYREGAVPSSVRPDAVMDAVVASMQGEIAQRHVTITRTYESSAELTAIEPDLHRSFVNVIQNALENLTDGGRIRIRLSNSRNWQTQARGIRIVIADTGRGIPKARLQSLFDPFVSTKLQRGSGLGLWVVRTIAEKYSGSVKVRSSIISGRSGTVVSMFLPTTKRPKDDVVTRRIRRATPLDRTNKAS